MILALILHVSLFFPHLFRVHRKSDAFEVQIRTFIVLNMQIPSWSLECILRVQGIYKICVFAAMKVILFGTQGKFRTTSLKLL